MVPVLLPTARSRSRQPRWELLSAAVADWRRTDSGAGGAVEQHARWVSWCTDNGIEQDGLALAISFFLGRDSWGPDATVWEALRTVVAARPHPNPYDVALARALGWRNPDLGVRYAPGQVCEQAVLALMEQVQASLGVSLRLLDLVTGAQVTARDDRASMAGAIAMSLLGVCDCGHHVRGCHGCGRGCCFPDHDLRTWDPVTCHLRPFVDQAVRGTAQRRLLGGAFAESMLYRLLAAEGRLLCRTVEWGRCEDCGRTFEGVRCPSSPTHGATPVRREPRKNQIIVPATVGIEGHVPVQRWWCGACRHLYGFAGDPRGTVQPCPRCAGAPSASKAVWTLATGPRVPQLV